MFTFVVENWTGENWVVCAGFTRYEDASLFVECAGCDFDHYRIQPAK